MTESEVMALQLENERLRNLVNNLETQIEWLCKKVSDLSKKKSGEKKTYSFEEIQQKHGNAYMPWEKEADEYLIRLYNEGRSIKEIAEIFERNNGGIRSRLKKLGKLNN